MWSSASAWTLASEAVWLEAQHDRSFPRSDFLDFVEGEHAPASRAEAASADDEFVWVIGMLLVAEMIEPAEIRAVACQHPVAFGGSEQATEL